MGIKLSPYTDALLESIKIAKDQKKHSDSTHISVSQTVSFFALMYEKVRNSIEFREEHLVCRAAIERILRRRLAINPAGDGEGENVVRELLWARYMSPENVTQKDVALVQHIINSLIHFRKQLEQSGHKISELENQYLLDIVTCEIEEGINIVRTQTMSAYLYFFYQVMRQKIDIEGLSSENRDAYFYAACEAGFAKNDSAYIRAHLFTLHYESFSQLTQEKITHLAEIWQETVRSLETIIKNQYSEKLIRSVKKNVPPFLILYDILEKNETELSEILADEEKLSESVEKTCGEKYIETSSKLRTTTIRSVIYIFLTKVIFVLLLEFPLSKFLYGMVEYGPLVINIISPLVLMGLLVSFFRVPGAKNTTKIYTRIINIINDDDSFETTPIKISPANKKIRRPLLVFGFTIAYFVFFGITFSMIYLLLSRLGFSIINKGVFFFFMTVVGFFGYRIRQTTKEYSLEDTDGVLSPVIYFLFLPVLSVGKFLSREVAKLNILMLVFDLLIEAPYKLIVEIVEEWVKFVRARRDEI